MGGSLSYYIQVEKMRPLGANQYAAKPILSRNFSPSPNDEAPPLGELWAPSKTEAISKVRSAMHEWADRTGYTLSEY